VRKTPLYSRSRAPLAGPQPGSDVPLPPAEPQDSRGREFGTSHAPAPARWRRLRGWGARHERALWVVAALLVLVVDWAVQHPLTPRPAPLTMPQIDAAMRRSIEDKPLAAAAARAYETILPSVVRVVGLMTEGDDGGDDEHLGPVERGVGTGVVIVDNGTILTNLHVIHGARRIRVSFMDGTESEAVVLSTQPQNDLAVLRAKTIPDDLQPATMRSTADLAPGDQVLAVGFPFGIGPSASAGIVSGLKREFRSPEGQQTLTNLIQFDAAANPGNSGGPLVTMDGEVVGIVTAILNPSHQRTFIGIGFAVPIENAAAAVGLSPF
jgi:S1-C subfamily serine protease